jgi:hypothetical protein
MLREGFESPEAHVAVVQLAPWTGYGNNGEHIARLRQAQLSASAPLHRVSVVPAVDTGDIQIHTVSGESISRGGVHPRDKQTIGLRTASAALSVLYGGSSTPFSGPLYASAVAGGGPTGTLSATVSFRPIAGGLILRKDERYNACPSVFREQSECAGFSVQGVDGKWYAATAELTGGLKLVLTAVDAPAGLDAAATSCGWGSWPLVPVFSRAGLPAFPWSARVSGG